MTLIPATIAASFTLASGTIHVLKPLSAAAHTIGSIPVIGLTLPSRLSSPITNTPSSLSSSIIQLAESIPAAIGRSKPVPSFLISAGDILTTILCGFSS